MIENRSARRDIQVWSPRKVPWRRERQPTPLFLPGQSHGQRSLAGYSPWGHRESDPWGHRESDPWGHRESDPWGHRESDPWGHRESDTAERLTLSLSSLECAGAPLDLSILQMAPPLGDLLKLYPRFLTSGRIHLSPPPSKSLGRSSTCPSVRYSLKHAFGPTGLWAVHAGLTWALFNLSKQADTK